jgi:hypothetical protein
LFGARDHMNQTYATTTEYGKRAFAWLRPIVLPFAAVFLVNVVVFGNILNLHTYKAEGIYLFSESEEYLVRSVVDLIDKGGETSNGIINIYMNSKDSVGSHFDCGNRFLCALFASDRNKRGFIASHILEHVIHPVWNCLGERSGGSTAFVQFGAEPPQCYDTYLSSVTVISVETHASVESVNDTLRAFREKLRKVKDELEWEPAAQASRSMQHGQERLIAFARKMRLMCRENSAGVDYCSDVDLTSDDIENMTANLQTFARFVEMNGEDSRITPVDFLIKNAVGSLLGVLFICLLNATVNLHRHGGAHAPQNPDSSGGSSM